MYTYHHPPTRTRINTTRITTHQRVSPPTNAYHHPPAAVVDLAALAAATTIASATTLKRYNACDALGDAGAITTTAAAAAVSSRLHGVGRSGSDDGASGYARGV